MTKQLYPYQEEAVRLAVSRNALIMDDPGLGKTLVGVETAARVQAQLPPPAPVLVICPKGVRGQWVDTILTQYPQATVDVLDTRSPTTRDQYRNQLWVVTHYEALVRHINQQANPLTATSWAAVVLDEAHRICNRQADRTRATKKLKAYRKLALTASPLEKSPADLWSLLNWLYPKVYRGYWGFAAKYAVQASHRGYLRIVPGVRNPELLAGELASFSLRRTKYDVAPWLPPLIQTRVPVPLNDRQAKLYHRIEQADDLVVDWDTSWTDGRLLPPLLITQEMTRITRLLQVTSCPASLGPQYAYASSAKIDWVLEWVADHPEQTVLIFTMFRETAQQLARMLHDQATLLLGNEPVPAGATRIVTTIARGGEGLDLPWIDNTIFVDCHWSSVLMTQALGRTHRINIETPKNVLYLYAPGTVDEDVLDAVALKWETVDLVYHTLRRRRLV